MISIWLWPLSLVYALVVLITRHLYVWGILPSFRSPKPVISVGNITVGGVGKTPLVIWLARQMLARGLKPAILIRGYKAHAGLSDEAQMLKEALPQVPVLVGRDRKKSIEAALANSPVDVFICDDAFQHWPLQRDMDIVAIDAQNPFGNGCLLPAGHLREPLGALKRAQVFLLTKTDLTKAPTTLLSKLKTLNTRALIVQSRHAFVGFKDTFTGTPAGKFDKAIGFCAIGDPASFTATIAAQGIGLVKNFVYADHHHYSDAEIKSMVASAKGQGIHVLVTTHKDAVKLQSFKNLFNGVRVVYADIQLEITQGSDEFIQHISSRCRR